MADAANLSMSANESPYYSIGTFSLMGPLAFFYSCASNLIFRVASIIQQRPCPPLFSLLEPTTAAKPKQQQRVAIVTGSNTGIGFETARSLVVEHSVTVILACRSRDKALQAATRINQAATAADTSSGTSTAKAVFVHPLDLTDAESIDQFCAAVKLDYPEIAILVNNAGRNTNAVSSDNKLDVLFQSNFLGHFQLTAKLMPLLKKKARIVNLSSVMHHFCAGPIDTEQYWLQMALQNGHQDTYSASKLAAQLFTNELNRRYGSRVRSIAVNPGAV